MKSEKKPILAINYFSDYRQLNLDISNSCFSFSRYINKSFPQVYSRSFLLPYTSAVSYVHVKQCEDVTRLRYGSQLGWVSIPSWLLKERGHEEVKEIGARGKSCRMVEKSWSGSEIRLVGKWERSFILQQQQQL